MNLDQMTPEARKLAERRGYRQTDPKPRSRGVTIGNEDLSDLLTEFEYVAEMGGQRIRGELTLEGGVPRDLSRMFGDTLLLWDGGAVREATVTSVRVDGGPRAAYGGTRIRIEFEGWQ